MRYLFLFVSLCIATSSLARNYRLKTQDGKAVMTISVKEGLSYSLTIDGTTVLLDSKIGFTASGKPKVTKTKHRGVWTPLWGKRSEVRDDYNALSLVYNDKTFEFRAYNDGFAWRCVNTAETVVWKETSDFNFAGNYTAWYYNGENHNIGPEPLNDADGNRQPLMTIECNDQLYLAVHEACLYQGKPLLLRSETGSKRFDIISEETQYHQGDASAWRVVMFGRTPGTLVDSHILELLNPEPEGDFTWVKPGTYLWDWRIDGAIWEDFHYGMNYESWVRMIDFAKKQGFTGLVLDANWYGPEFEKDSNPVTGEKARDVQRIIDYGKSKGIGVWLYLNDVAGSNYPIEETLKQYESWGSAGVKYGFMEGSPTERNTKTVNITRLCAKHHLCVDFHDHPVHPWGQARTYPNALTREYCKAQLDGHQIFYPKTFVTSAFVNNIAGPIDQNNGFFDLRQGPTTRVDNNQEVPTTVCAEAARVFITYSGAAVIPDIPEYYQKHPSLLEFLSAHKQPWKESKTLAGKIGEYIVTVRQNAEGQYILAAATNEEARTITIPLDFLPTKTFRAKITEDAPDAHYLTNHAATQYREVEVVGGRNGSTLTLSLAPGGGACVLFAPF